jgi:hypothetical protein
VALSNALMLALPPRLAAADTLKPTLLVDLAQAELGKGIATQRETLAYTTTRFVMAGLVTDEEVSRRLWQRNSETSVHSLLAAGFESWVEKIALDACRAVGVSPKRALRYMALSVSKFRDANAYHGNSIDEDQPHQVLALTYAADYAYYNFSRLNDLPEEVATTCWFALIAIRAFLAGALLPDELAEYAGYENYIYEYRELKKTGLHKDPAKALVAIQKNQGRFDWFAQYEDVESLAVEMDRAKAMCAKSPAWMKAPRMHFYKDPKTAALALRKLLRSNSRAFARYPRLDRFVQGVAGAVESPYAHRANFDAPAYLEYSEDEVAHLGAGTYWNLGRGFEQEVVDTYIDQLAQQGTYFGIFCDLDKLDFAAVADVAKAYTVGHLLCGELEKSLAHVNKKPACGAGTKRSNGRKKRRS